MQQDTGITYYFGQELSNNKTSIEDYIKKIEGVKRENILDVANKIDINTIYFLRD